VTRVEIAPTPGGIARSGLLARLIVTGVLAPGIGPRIAAVEPQPIMRAVLRGGLGDKTALRPDYLDELLRVGRRPGYPTVARAVYANLPCLIAARARYPEASAPVHLIYGEGHGRTRRTDSGAEVHSAVDARPCIASGLRFAGARPVLDRVRRVAVLALASRQPSTRRAVR
jgi:hypothetical protein